MKKIAVAATLIFSTVAAFNNTGSYLTKLFFTNANHIVTAPTIKLTSDFIPMTIGRADLAQADGDQQ